MQLTYFLPVSKIIQQSFLLTSITQPNFEIQCAGQCFFKKLQIINLFS